MQKILPHREENRELLKSLLSSLQPPEEISVRMEDADQKWIEGVTGISKEYRVWTAYESELDTSILPTPDFKECYLNVLNYFDLSSHASRFVLVSVILRDILLRAEFGKSLCIFPSVQLSVKTIVNATSNRRLVGKTHVAIGSRESIPEGGEPKRHNLRLIVAEARNDDSEWRDVCLCTAQIATIYKLRRDSGCSDCRVWGVITIASHWEFIHVDSTGKLWRSPVQLVELLRFDENQIFKLYRFLYHVVKCCFDSCL